MLFKETYTNEEGTVKGSENPDQPQIGSEATIDPERPNRNKIHSSAMYAASKWHSTVKHVKPPHAGGSFLPLQA